MARLTLQLSHGEALGLSFCGSRQVVYNWLEPQARKDLTRSTGLLDHHFSPLLLRDQRTCVPGQLTPAQRFHSVVVGCVLTNDRMAASGRASSSTCRFCGARKDSIRHLVCGCDSLHSTVGPPALHQLGENSAVTGIAQHPRDFAKRRLLTMPVKDTTVPMFQPDRCISLMDRWVCSHFC